MTDEREKRLERAMDSMGENTKAGAIDRALKHYLADRRNKEQVADELATLDEQDAATRDEWEEISTEMITTATDCRDAARSQTIRKRSPDSATQ